jgi:anti-sigma B factor antagonist
MKTKKTVTVKQLPERLNLKGVREVVREIAPILKSDQPFVVFDFARVRQMDGAGVEMLLECIEQVMKQDGDIKLAAVPPELGVILELTRVDRLFEIFETTADAVESFHRFWTAPVQPYSRASTVSTNPNGNGHFKLVS